MTLTEIVGPGKKLTLKKPKKIIKVEIIGAHAGISLLESEELLTEVSKSGI